jgi:hypothetical protein
MKTTRAQLRACTKMYMSLYLCSPLYDKWGPLVSIFFLLSSPFLLFSTVLVWPAGHHYSTPRPSLLHGLCSTDDPTCSMDVARARFCRRGGHLSSISPQRISPKLDSPERMPPLGRAGGGAKHLHQGLPPSTSSCSIGAGAGGELHRGLQSFVSPRPLLHPASALAPPPGPRPANSAPRAYSLVVARPAAGSPLDLCWDRSLSPPPLRAALPPSSQIRAPRPATAPPKSGSRLPATAIGPAPRTARMRR